MLNIDSILPLYPDDASRQLLLSQALTQTKTDLAALRCALATGDRDAALAHTHQAKGTVSFLGCDAQVLQRFDQLTHVLRKTNIHALPLIERVPANAVAGSGHPHTARASTADHPAANTMIDAEPIADNAAADMALQAQLDAAFKAVESLLQDMEVALQACINAQQNGTIPAQNK